MSMSKMVGLTAGTLQLCRPMILRKQQYWKPSNQPVLNGHYTRVKTLDEETYFGCMLFIRI